MTIVTPTPQEANAYIAKAHAAVSAMLRDLPLSYDTLPSSDVVLRLEAIVNTTQLSARSFPRPFSDLWVAATDHKRTEVFLVSGLRRTLADTLKILEQQTKKNNEATEALVTA